MLGKWKAVGENLPLITLSSDGTARLHSTDEASDGLFGVWHIENNDRLVLLLKIPPVPGSDNEALREGAQEALRFTIVERTDSTMTLENDDRSIHARYERVGDA